MTHIDIPHGLAAPLDSPEKLRTARRNVGMKMGFYIHATVYVLVNAFLTAVNLASSGGQVWFKWPLLGWGLGLAIHGAVVWFQIGGGGIRERMLRDELERLTKP